MRNSCAHPKSTLQAVTIHEALPARRTGIAALFVVLHALTVSYCISTAGEPYLAALAQQAKLDNETNATNATIDTFETDGALGTAAAAEQSKSPASAEPLPIPPSTPPSPSPSPGGFGDEWEDDLDFGSSGDSAYDPVAANASAPTNGSAVNGTAVKKERPLPHEWLPSALACALLFLSVTANIFFYLLCHWSKTFKATALFAPSAEPAAGKYIHFRPLPHKGRPAIVKLTRNERSGTLTCEYQRQRFELLSMEEALSSTLASDAELAHTEGALWAVRLTRCPVNHPHQQYTSSKGLSDSEEVAGAVAKYGANMIAVPTPRFVDLYVEQLLSPLVIFQIFTSALWLLDAVSIGFTIFQVVSILLLESTSVFQRQRTLKTLNQMSAKPYNLPVFREGKWQSLPTTALAPGDLISLSPPSARSSANVTGGSSKSTDAAATATADASVTAVTPSGTPPTAAAPAPDLVIPCDCVLLRGSSVVNEASLTGESVPQMKDRLANEAKADGTDKRLDITGADRVHVMFAGTTLVTATQGAQDVSNAAVPATPDNGCLCYVLRSGFLSAQGELMMMIEFSQQKVSDDSRDTMLALFILLVFALMASTYVFRRGLEKGDRTTHELLLKCVIIVTSVVPRHLPMQTALAVNTALMALMKAGVMCTEPFRVPTAGKISSILFDKTGTLTTDKLVPVAIVNADCDSAKPEELAVSAASTRASIVLGGCHSLISIGESEELLGDPIETAALSGVKWSYTHSSQTATPGEMKLIQAQIAKLEEQLKPKESPGMTLTGEMAKPPPPLPEGTATKLKEELKTAQEALAKAKELAERSDIASVRIVHRHHFSSALQRMSTVVVVKRKSGASSTCCLVKGSPEAIQPLLVASSTPAWYDDAYRSLAERGMRVLALAHKDVDETPAAVAAYHRNDVESALHFDGFIAFACMTRADSPVVVRALLDSAHSVSMLTGDAPLTALHVAKEVGICDKSGKRTELLLTSTPSAAAASASKAPAPALRWVRAVGGSDATIVDFDVSATRELATRYDLMVTDATLEVAAAATDGALWSYMDCFRVFARMSPTGKAQVIRMLQERNGNKVLMCGDGGNDVGALKQSDVGLALLSGYGNTNTTEDVATDKPPENEAHMSSAEVALNNSAKALHTKAMESAKLQREALKAKQKELSALQQVWMREELAAMEARGEPVGAMATMRVMKSTFGRMQRELMAERQRLASIHGNIYDDAKKAAIDGMGGGGETDLPMVRPGDASVAAPFTSRAPSVRHIVDLIRQGRCTLLSALQQQQIMMLESTISAFVLSALSLEGARSSERQMIASSWLLMIASLAFSYATPLEKMHPERPLKSLFHPAIAASMAGQAAIHLFAMYTAVHMSRDVMGPEKLAEVVEFHRREALREKQQELSDQAMEDGDYMASMMAMWTTPFMPNLLNTSVFLVETSQCIAVLLVNYKGRPFMKGISENHPLFLSVFACVAGCVCCAWGVFPELNALIHLEPFPDDAFRFKVIGLVLASLAGTFIWDRICTALFAPKIFKAMVDEAKTSTLADALPALQSLGKVLGVLILLSTGNLVVIGFAWWGYKKYSAAQAAQAAQAGR